MCFDPTKTPKTEMMTCPLSVLAITATLFSILVTGRLQAEALDDGFATPKQEHRPETWFHLIGGNVNKTGLTKDLEAISAAGIQGGSCFTGKVVLGVA
jgi:hypothetical protein